MKLCIALVVALVGCGKDKPAPTPKDDLNALWGPHKITTVEMGDFAAPIPAGWRDGSEFLDKQIVSGVPPGARIVMVEKPERAEGFQANIILMWLDAKTYAPLTCEQLADEMSKEAKLDRLKQPAKESTTGADRTCVWETSHEDAHGEMHVRFNKDHALFMQCLRAAKGDPIGDSGCGALWISLAAK